MTTEEMAKVMIAYTEGKPIERRCAFDTYWEEDELPAWCWGVYEYRIKPNPMELKDTDDCYIVKETVSEIIEKVKNAKEIDTNDQC